MALSHLDHVTVNCADLDRSRAFYGEALGLVEGKRPSFPFPGAWFYLDARPVLHLVSGSDSGAHSSTGAFDHVAFEAIDIDRVLARLKGLGVVTVVTDIPNAGVRQVFVHDPDGVKIELNFRD